MACGKENQAAQKNFPVKKFSAPAFETRTPRHDDQGSKQECDKTETVLVEITRPLTVHAKNADDDAWIEKSEQENCGHNCRCKKSGTGERGHVALLEMTYL